MPKWIMFTLAAAALALSACNSGPNLSSLVGNATPTPAPTAYSPNPSVTAATILFTVAKTPVPNQPIYESTPDANGHLGSPTPIATATTDANGNATFSSLTPTQSYCWYTMYTAPGAANSTTYSDCTLYWQGGTIPLGT